jgi:hypothetical protein
VPGDAIRLQTNDTLIMALADRLWERAPAPAQRSAPLILTIDVTPANATTPAVAVATERWHVGAHVAEVIVNDVLWARTDWARGQLTGRVSADLVRQRPSLAARLLLEVPTAVLLARRGYSVVHAGGVTGPAGAVVIRGAAGAGKSTLVAAAHQAGFNVLGDETVLVSRGDADDILAAVRDVTLLPDATWLLNLGHLVTADHSGTELKNRLDLFASSSPPARYARRAAAVVLGPRHGPARLELLAPESFVEEFRNGEIRQERWSGTSPEVAVHWSRRAAFRLSGTADLKGALELLGELVDLPAAVSPA